MKREEKIKDTIQLYNNKLSNLTSSVEAWQSFVKASAKFYKYSFAEQVLITTQRPDAEAVAEFDYWSKVFNRQIIKHSKGIPILDTDENGNTKLRYLFDVADTSATERSRKINIWQMKNEYINTVTDNLAIKYDVKGSDLMSICISLYEKQLAVYEKDIQDIIAAKDGSMLASLPDEDIRNSIYMLGMTSVVEAVYARCGMDAEIDGFQYGGIGNFNTPDLIVRLGSFVSRISSNILRDIEREVRAIERSNKNERSNDKNDKRELSGNLGMEYENGEIYGADLTSFENRQTKDRFYGYGQNGGERVFTKVDRGERSDIHSGGGILHVPSAIGDPGTDGVRVGNVGQGKSQLSEERGQRDLGVYEDEVYASKTSDRNGESSQSNGRKANEAANGGRGNNRGAKTERPDRMGTPIQQPETQSVGDNSRGTDIRINDTETAEEAKSPAVSSLQIIGNTPYRYISKKTYRKLSDDISQTLIDMLADTDIKYSGKHNNDDTVTFTFSKDNIEQADKLIAAAKENNKRGFDRDEVEIAKNTDLVAFLSSRGEHLKKVGREYTMQEHDSMRINGNQFYWNSRSVGGNAVSFCMEYYGMDFKSAVAELLNFNGYNTELQSGSIRPTAVQKEQSKIPESEERHNPLLNPLDDKTNRVYAYLKKTRGISGDIVKRFLDEGIIKQDIKGNAVFLTFDKDNNLSGAELSGTLSDKKYKNSTERNGNGFTINPKGDNKPEKVMFFESAIDALSHYDMHRDTNALLVSMAGLKDNVVLNTLEKYGLSYENAIISSDNDEAGRNFAEKMKNNYGIPAYSIVDDEIYKICGSEKHKDWNDLLKSYKENLIDKSRELIEDLPKEDYQKSTQAAGDAQNEQKQENDTAIQIIGNTPYKYVPKKTYRKFEKELGLKIAYRLSTFSDIKYSGKIDDNGTLTLTFDGNRIDEVEKIINSFEPTEKATEEKEVPTSSQIGTKSETIDFHQQGAFYEAYGDNALKAAPILGLHTTTKNGEPMVGIPQHTAEEYFQKLKENGYSVNLSEETKLAAETKVTERAENKLEEKSTSSQVGTKSETDFSSIVKNAQEHYNLLYENTDNDKFFSEAVAQGEKFIRENPEFMTGLYNVRKDTYSSDREVASLAFALADVGMIEKFTDEISRTETKQENSQRIDLMSDGSPTDDIIPKVDEAKEMTLLISKENENFDDIVNKLMSVVPVTSELDKSIIAPVYSDNVDFITQVLEEYGAKYEVIDKHYEEFKAETSSQVGTKSETVEQTSVSEPPKNFVITDNELGYGGQKEKYHRNIEAIKTLYTVERENRQATPQEQKILSKYVGWGGIADVFDERKATWANEYQELKELLPTPEYNAARASVNNAHFTSPVIIKAMYDVLKNMGFKDGYILEPSLGIGNFFGMLPKEMNGSKLYGVEIDSITGRIAKQLYPNAHIQIKGFEKTSFTSNTFDVAIGNVPFGNYRVYDSSFKSNDLIHDFFFKKSLDKVRPGGVVAFITSKGTLDKQNTAVREYLAQRADLLGAIRLPNNAFKANAGTEVTSDIIFLQKRDTIRDFSKEEMPDWVRTAVNENGIEMNSYFINNPDMVLGEMVEVSGQYGMESTCKPTEGKELSELLEEAVSNIKGTIPENIYAEPSKETKTDTQKNIYPENYRNFCYTVIDGAIYYRENDNMIQQNISGKKADILKGMIGISEILRDLIACQRDNYPDEYIKRQQDKLNKAYDEFTEKYGLIADHKGLFKTDDSSPLLFSLENLDENGKLLSKADIFTKRTIMAYEPVTSVDTASEALAVSISEKACVDLDFMSELCSKPKDDIIKELEGVIFENPVTNQYETSDEYLSGNVRKKLETAKEYAALNGKYEVNVKALESVQPEPLSAAQISVQLGASWVPVKYYEQFMYETFNTPDRCKSDCIWRNKDKNPFSSSVRSDNETITIDYNASEAEYGISNKTSFAADRDNLTVTSTYGTKRLNAYQILESTLNQKPVKVVDYVDDGHGKKVAVPNEKETLLAQEKQNEIKQKFTEWIFDDFDRTEELCRIYNEKFNSVRLREYDGSHLNFVGMNPEITLRKHQVDAIAHTIYGGNTLLAHTVGAGKSFEMIASAMESKRLGLCSKSLICVPKHIVNQFAKEFLQLYPGANILVPDEKDFSKANRQKFCSRIATGNYDAIILSHTQLEKIPLSEERQREFIQAEIEKLTYTIGETTKDNNRGFTVKQLEGNKKNLEARLEKLNNNEKRDTVVTFEELGVDRLYIDEAHAFKNLYFTSKMGRNVSGINTSSMSQRATDLYMKVRYLDEITDSRGTTFATGTPVFTPYPYLKTLYLSTFQCHRQVENIGLPVFFMLSDIK